MHTMKTSILFLLLGSCLITQAQSDRRDNDLFYSITAGAGIGHSPNFEESTNGPGAMLGFSLHKNKSMATMGYRATGEAQLLSPATPAHTMSSLELSYGRMLTDKKLSISLNAGIAMVQRLERGEFLYADPGFFAARYYEKVKSFTLGVPISLKTLLCLTKHFGLGVEGYYNINRLDNFYGLNLVASFGKYQFIRKKAKL